MPSLSSTKGRSKSLSSPSGFMQTVADNGRALERAPLTRLQINTGRLCNQACRHCHVEAGPNAKEVITQQVAERIIALLDSAPTIQIVDLTGGAPEIVPPFRYLVQECTRRKRSVVDRCNLTTFFEPGQEDLADFLAVHHVQIFASLPCYTAENVDHQRGHGTFDKSIRALQILNQRGYGVPQSERILNLVYNPLGASLPPKTKILEEQFRSGLADRFGIRFNSLVTITNMPIGRFLKQLQREGKTDDYMQLLIQNFNPATVEGLMCRSLVSINWDGRLSDCDFNQMLDRPVALKRPTIWDIDSLLDIKEVPIVTAPHCYGCTAGVGSSCYGSLD